MASAADTISASSMDSSAALIELTDPIGLAKLSTETGSFHRSFRLLFKLALSIHSLVRRTDGTINRFFANLMEFKMPANEVPDRYGVSSKDVVIDPHTGSWVRVFLPQAKVSHEIGDGKAKKRPVIFYFHGGGFAVMSADVFLYDVFCRRLCRSSDAVVISVNYRRAPEHRYPVAYEDCYAALEWLEGFRGHLFQPHELDLSRCVLIGDSAGANIVHHIGCRWAARDEEAASKTCNSAQPTGWQLKIGAHVLLFPYFGGEERTQSELRCEALVVSVESLDWYWRAFLPPNSNRDHPACNVLGPNAPDISALPLPPSLVVIAEHDILKDWQLRYAQGLARTSKPVRLLYYVGGIHCFHVLTNGQLFSHMMTDIISFINQRIGKPI